MAEYTKQQRSKAVAAVIAGLRAGTPLTVICSAEGMPCDDTIRNWADADEKLARAIARARETGFDQIAMDALTIADTPLIGETVTEKPFMVDGEEVGTTREVRTDDMLGHRKLQVDTRLKLLAKWDPKRYGDKTLVGSDPDNPLPAGFTVNLVKREQSAD